MKRLSGKMYLFFAALLWSILGLFSKQISWSGLTIGIIRGAVSAGCMLLLFRRLPKKPTKFGLLTAVCYFTQGVLIVAANKYTTAANAMVIQNTSPLYIMLFTALAVKHLPKWREAVTCLLLLLGTALTAAGNTAGSGTIGNLMALSAAVFYAGVYFGSSRDGVDSAESIYLGNLMYFLFVPFCLTDSAFRAATATDWLFVLILGITVTAAWLCFSKGLETTPPLEANFITILEVVLSPLWTFLFLGETPRLLSLVGYVLILGTLMVHNISQNKTE